jgi:alpha-L-fucosidase/lysophospholipase L1-like esterase
MYEAKLTSTLIIFMAMLLFTPLLREPVSAGPGAAHKRVVACIGNSITFGDGIQDKERHSYPALLQKLLGDDWDVHNFGVGGRTLLHNGDFPWRNEPQYKAAKDCRPDIVIIKLGTNDTKPWNWKFKESFIPDYLQLIDEFRALPSRPVIYVCLPVPAFPGEWGISDSVLTTDVIPMIRIIASKRPVRVIDLRTPLEGKREFFPDKVHPNEDGAMVMARTIYGVFCKDYRLVPLPEPFGPTPAVRQIDWQDLGYTAFVHFNMNTFTGSEWGKGTESPDLFNPARLDCEQWVRTFRDAGMKGVIITAKHHDGFCLWPTQLTGHSVGQSKWRGGDGDVLQDLSAACKKYGMKFGVYLSPWDRHEPSYGDSERYNDFFRKQLREVLTQYGDIFEVWFDGACGEGPNGKKQVYDWASYVNVVRMYQPNAVIFSDGGPDVRWVGNENGFANPLNWSLLRKKDVYPGYPKYQELTSGHSDGTDWIPAECDVSIRPNWYFRAGDDTAVKSPDALFTLWLKSVGRNASLLLNVPPNSEGLIARQDSAVLMEFKKLRDEAFSTDFAAGAAATASNIRGKDRRFAAENLADGNPRTFWAADDNVTTATLTLALKKPAAVNCIRLSEYIPLGQRVESFTVSGNTGKGWKKLASGTTVGNGRMLTFPAARVSRIRVSINASRACPVVSGISLYKIPDRFVGADD